MARRAVGEINLDNLLEEDLRHVECYEKLEKIGEGGFGQVYMARDVETKEIVALKKIVRAKDEYQQILLSIKQEAKIISMLHHENIAQLKEIVISPDPEMDEQGNPDGSELYMVFEYMNHDLWGLIYNDKVQITVPHIKCYMRQLLTGLHYLHDNGVLHRDIKVANILLDKEGNLKIADFGHARTLPSDPNEALTKKVITLCYRPPELLLGSCNYGPAVDMWSAGCVFVELLRRKPFLKGENEIDQLKAIYLMFGGATEANWPEVSKLPLYKYLMPKTEMKSSFKYTLRNHDPHAVMLLEKMLTLDPSQRISAKDALEHDYFHVEPLPCYPTSQLKCESCLNHLVNKRRAEKPQHEGSSTDQTVPHAAWP